MNRRSLHINKLLYICFAIVVVILVFLIFSRLYIAKMTSYNDKKAMNFIDESLQYVVEISEDEKNTLIQLSEEKYLSPEVRGHVFERLSLFYSPDSTPVLYFDTIGKAIYYLEQGNDVITLSNIYADIANYYYMHSDSSLAQDTLNQLYALTSIDDIDNFQQKSYLHRLQGILDTVNGDYDIAQEHLLRSLEEVGNDPGPALYGPSYIAISEVNLAALYYKTGEYDKCLELVNKYEDSEFFTTDIYEDILARDFKIPYYKVALNIRTHNNEIPKVEPLIISFMELCEKYNYRNIELEQLTYMQENLPAKSPEFDQRMIEKISECYNYINQDLYHRQAIFSDSQINFSKQNTLEKEKEQAETRSQRVKLWISILLFLVFLLVIALIFTQSNCDALTKVGNRHALNRILFLYNRFNKGYSAIMIDIDNFKSVNDTFGHDKGDDVLRGLGRILLSEKHDGFTPYRYGGEEFVLILNESDEKKALHTAERIRVSMGNMVFDGIDRQITISIGVGFPHAAEVDVIKEADNNLYYSKNHGKNVVSYNKSGETVLYKS